MTAYYVLILVLVVLGWLLSRGKKNRKKELIFLLLVFLILGGMSALRYSTGYDYGYVYAPDYEKVLLNDPPVEYGDQRFEPGYFYLEKAIALISDNYQMIFVVTSLLIMALFCWVFWKYSSNVYLTAILFVLLGEYYCSMNFIRQTLAAVICMLALKYLQNKKLIPYLLITLVAACFHKSALIMIPFFFVNLIPITKIVVAIYAVISTGIYIFSEEILSVVTQFYYQKYGETSKHITSTFEWPFTVAMLVLFLIVFLNREKLLKRDRKNYVYVNYAFFALFFTLMGTKHSILDRFSLYFTLAFPISLALIWDELKKVFDSREVKEPVMEMHVNYRKSLVKCSAFAALLLVGGLTYHQYVLIMDHHGVVPYQCILTQNFYWDYLDMLDAPVNEDGEREKPVYEPEEEPVFDDEVLDEWLYPEEPLLESAEPILPPESETAEESTPTETPSGAPMEVPLDIPSTVPEGMPMEVPLGA